MYNCTKIIFIIKLEFRLSLVFRCFFDTLSKNYPITVLPYYYWLPISFCGEQLCYSITYTICYLSVAAASDGHVHGCPPVPARFPQQPGDVPAAPGDVRRPGTLHGGYGRCEVRRETGTRGQRLHRVCYH